MRLASILGLRGGVGITAISYEDPHNLHRADINEPHQRCLVIVPNEVCSEKHRLERLSATIQLLVGVHSRESFACSNRSRSCTTRRVLVDDTGFVGAETALARDVNRDRHS